MGVFNVSSVNEGFTPSELDIVNADNIMMGENFAQTAIMDAADYIQEHSDLIRAMGAQEISITESGEEVIYESSTLGGIGEKIKGLIKKFIAKIKELISKAIAVFNSWFQSDKDFINKYSKTFTTNWVKVKKLKVKAYKYHDSVKSFSALSVNVKEDQLNSAFEALPFVTDAIKADIKTEAQAKAAIEDINKIDNTDMAEAIRGVIFNDLTKSNGSSMTSKEFSEELYEFWRTGDSAKEEMDKSELESNGYSAANIIATLQNGEKKTKELEKAFRKIEKASNKWIKDNIDKKLKEETKFNSNAADNAVKTGKAAVLTLMSSFTSTVTESLHTGAGIYVQLCKEYSRTCKSIATKVVAMGEKRLAQEESYDFGNDDDNNDDYSTSYMNAVVIK